MRFALIAGEASGDILGAALIHALRARFPDARFEGVAGPRMIAAGCEVLADIDALSVMGFVEVLPKLLGILRLRRRLRKRLLVDRPDVVVGIDAPDFNLALERKLRRAGLKTVHLVSPSVWAWRQGRVKTIARSVDLMLCLFPFEPAFYADHGVRARYVGHPLADELVNPPQRKAARHSLDLPEHAPVVTILPGSRAGELKYLAAPFVQAAARLGRHVQDVEFVVPLAKPSLRPQFEAAIATAPPGLRWHLLDGHSREAMRAGDVVLLASGTATLECLLLDRPMVVGYRASRVTAWLLRALGLVKIERFSLPNILCAESVVPELIQEQATAERFADAVGALLDDPAARRRQTEAFAPVRIELRRDAAARAAEAIAGLVVEP